MDILFPVLLAIKAHSSNHKVRDLLCSRNKDIFRVHSQIKEFSLFLLRFDEPWLAINPEDLEMDHIDSNMAFYLKANLLTTF